MATVNEIKQQISSGTPASIYVLHGEEGYYLDELVKNFEAMVPESEKDFNLYVLYAPQVGADMVVDACLRYPMMAERQVVILKEAQAVNANYINSLAAYAEHPNPSTVFVLVCRGAKLTGAKFLKAVAASKGVVFESKKIYENSIGPTLTAMAKDAGLTLDAKAREMLVDHVGTDLSRMVNEINKLKVALPPGSAITPQAIEKLIGVSKDFNNSELLDALISRDAAKAYRIVEYFRNNPKPNPSIVTGVTIFNYFAKLLMAMYAPDKSESGISAATGVRSGARDMFRIKMGMQTYRPGHVVNAISACRRFDTRAKGIESRANEYDLLRELIFTILN